jgi:hypothetical protein
MSKFHDDNLFLAVSKFYSDRFLKDLFDNCHKTLHPYLPSEQYNNESSFSIHHSHSLKANLRFLQQCKSLEINLDADGQEKLN